jgi:hypothetical protein
MPELPLAPSCALDADGVRRQLARYRQAGAGARVIERSPRTLAVELSAAIDPAVVQQALATERECCPFFNLSWDADSRRLELSVSRPEDEPALEAIAFALGRLTRASSARRRSP